MQSPLTNDLNNVKDQFANDRRVQIHKIIPNEVATSLMHEVDQLDYEMAYTSSSQVSTITKAQLAQKTPQEQQMFLNGIFKDANKGIGFFYQRRGLSLSNNDQSVAQKVFQWLNSEATLNAVREVSGFDDIIAASGQLTRYLPGHFLTRHKDVHETEQRRIAYVLNITEAWHPDWGGLLQFYQDDGTPRDALTPSFNAMTLFDVKHVHAVTYVAPFASKPRLAISGWFRASPL